MTRPSVNYLRIGNTRSEYFHPERCHIRPSWHPHNLYSLHQRTKLPDFTRNSVFQQLWWAKREIKAYHFPWITNKQFLERHFPKGGLPLQQLTRAERERVPQMQSLLMCELERRVDMILFRAHFVDDIEKARKLVMDGEVLVNGEEVKYAFHTCRDGDMITLKDPSHLPYRQKDESSDTPKFQPVEWQAPWMFLPEYLEVDYDTCSAIFLRSPLPQPDRVEIPSPFPPAIHQLAFEWYHRTVRGREKDGARPRTAPNPLLDVQGRPVQLRRKYYHERRKEDNERRTAIFKLRKAKAMEESAKEKQAAAAAAASA
ncbi:mitochondrial 37S ribosomal protein nam9 [Rhizophlyctis rosea]|nr:mitochondrial 37S ribosomal protein nam9 [Rhizophlyctis rosea]